MKCAAPTAPIDFSGIDTSKNVTNHSTAEKDCFFLPCNQNLCINHTQAREKKALGLKSCREFSARKWGYQHIETQVFVEVYTYAAIWCSTAVQKQK